MNEKSKGYKGMLTFKKCKDCEDHFYIFVGNAEHHCLGEIIWSDDFQDTFFRAYGDDEVQVGIGTVFLHQIFIKMMQLSKVKKKALDKDKKQTLH